MTSTSSRILRGVAAAWAVCTAAACAGRTMAPETRRPDAVVLSIVATADLHGHIESLPWLAGHLRALREARQRDGGDVLLVDAGDMFQGTLESNLSEGASVVRAYDALGYDAAAIGNHEFDFGPEGASAVPRAPTDNPRGAIEARARDAHFPLLTANVRHRDGRPWTGPNLQPSVIVRKAGVSVGLIGVTTESTPSVTDARNLVGLEITPIAHAVAAEAAALRAAGATTIVLLAHAGAACTSFESPDDLSSCSPRQEIFDVVRTLPAGTVDAIAAGHTHRAVAHRVNGVPIVEAYAEGEAFGRIDLVVDRASGRVRDSRIFPPRLLCGAMRRTDTAARLEPCRPEPYEGKTIAADAGIDRLLAPARAQAAAVRDRSLNVHIVTPFRSGGRGESALGNLVADLMREARPESDVAVYNWGGLRSDLPEGDLTYGRLYKLVPFDNAFATLDLTAADLGAAIARSLGRGAVHSFSGVRIEVRCDGDRVRTEVRREDGRQVEPETRLKVIVTDFLATGGDGIFVGFPGARRIEPGPPMRDVIADVLASRGGSLNGRDPGLFNPSRPRLTFPGELPLRCQTLTEAPSR